MENNVVPIKPLHIQQEEGVRRVVSDADFQQLTDTLDQPSRPNDALKRALARYRNADTRKS